MAGIIDLVGNTPLVEIKKLNPNPKVQIYAKLEGNNPGRKCKRQGSTQYDQKCVGAWRYQKRIPLN
jgi:cysteine synthase